MRMDINEAWGNRTPVGVNHLARIAVDCSDRNDATAFHRDVPSLAICAGTVDDAAIFTNRS